MSTIETIQGYQEYPSFSDYPGYDCQKELGEILERFQMLKDPTSLRIHQWAKDTQDAFTPSIDYISQRVDLLQKTILVNSLDNITPLYDPFLLNGKVLIEKWNWDEMYQEDYSEPIPHLFAKALIDWCRIFFETVGQKPIFLVNESPGIVTDALASSFSSSSQIVYFTPSTTGMMKPMQKAVFYVNKIRDAEELIKNEEENQKNKAFTMELALLTTNFLKLNEEALLSFREEAANSNAQLRSELHEVGNNVNSLFEDTNQRVEHIEEVLSKEKMHNFELREENDRTRDVCRGLSHQISQMFIQIHQLQNRKQKSSCVIS